MLDAIKPLLDSGIINESTQQAISEAWEAKLSEAKETVGDIQKIVKTWPQHFAKCGVKPREIEMLEVNLSRLV